ncbi:septum formation inhibitor Maf [Advenella sp. S44]|uniref:Maf family protein n=1 Tax=Advenella sp. S44 TaxID=1982755 RepID=UPI000CB5AF95|nr:Maf family protein [Advenella sp. S44]PJX26303.1 septum formation inhibitor Maf [Advenella sp. S44]
MNIFGKTAIVTPLAGTTPSLTARIQEQAIFLASASPRRHELLKQMAIAHDVLHVPATPGEDEPLLPGEHPASYVKRTARDKAERALAHLHTSSLPPRPILTADTTVMMGSQILGKASTGDDVRKALAALAGQAHQVHTAIVLAWNNRFYEDVSITNVIMKPLSQDEIEWYVRSGEGIGKAGAYGIQGLASAFVESISGSYSGVMGLPLFETCRLLARAYSASD